LSVFYISYIIFEIPSNMACKAVGPGWFLPGITLAFGIVTVAFAFVRDIQSACGVRFVLGIFEAGMLPGIAYYMSRWYRRSELAFRLALYVVMAPLAGAFGGLLASAILRLDHFGSARRWEMIFAIEGIITIGLALIGFATLTDRPETARWLTHDEKQLALNRLKSERVGATEVLDKMDKKKLVRGIWNPVVIATSWAFLLACITVQGLAFFAPDYHQDHLPTSNCGLPAAYDGPSLHRWGGCYLGCQFYKLENRQASHIHGPQRTASHRRLHHVSCQRKHQSAVRSNVHHRHWRLQLRSSLQCTCGSECRQ
jgi:MFS family permease